MRPRFDLRLSLRSLVDPVTLLTIAGIAGFFFYYWPRFLVFIALGLGLVGLGAISQRRWEIAIPIQTFFLGTWTYNFFEGRDQAIVGIMFVFLGLLAYGFYRLLDKPNLRALSIFHVLYLLLATLVVWQLAVLITLFWPVEPWSRTFLVVAAMIFFERALAFRLGGTTQARLLLLPLFVILAITLIVILSTPIPIS